MVIIFHYSIFLDYHQDIFSQNFFAQIFSDISSKSRSFYKNILKKQEFYKLYEELSNLGFDFKLSHIQQIKTIDTNICDLVFPNKFKDLKELCKIQIQIENKNHLSNTAILKNFLTQNEINNIYKYSNLIILKSSYFNLISFTKIIFEDDIVEKFSKSFFQKAKNENKTNLLELFFEEKIFCFSNYEKRNIRNIIKQKTKLRFKTIKKYLNIEDEYKELIATYYYILYLYLDYLEALKNEFKINNKTIKEFLNWIDNYELKKGESFESNNLSIL